MPSSLSQRFFIDQPHVARTWQYGIPLGLVGITDGGNGGTIIEVTSTNESGAGSLRAALETSGKRTIVFGVAGVIDLDGNNINVAEGEFTIAGQTAPPPGITVIKGQINIAAGADDFIIMHIRAVVGDRGLSKGSGWEADAITTSSAKRGLIGYCSTLHGTDESLSISGTPFSGSDLESWRAGQSSDVAVFSCLMAESLADSTHSKASHSMGSVTNDNVRDAYWFGNMWVSCNERMPRIKAGVSVAAINNILANPGFTANLMWMNGDSDQWDFRDMEGIIADVVGNVVIKGQDTNASARLVRISGPQNVNLYHADNLTDGLTEVSNVGTGTTTIESALQIYPASARILPSAQVIQYVAANIGARPWDRNAVDARIIAGGLDGETAAVIDSQEEVEGYPTPGTVTTRAFDPDDWYLDTMAPKRRL